MFEFIRRRTKKYAEARAKMLSLLKEALTEARQHLPKKGEAPTFEQDWIRKRRVSVLIGGLGRVYNITPQDLGTTDDELKSLAMPRSAELRDAFC